MVIEDNREWIINSHRGAFKEGLLENSEESYIESWRQGANMLETDIRLTKDKQIVLMHNRTIDKIVSLAKIVPNPEKYNEKPTGPVGSHTLAYLKDFVFENGMHILTLEEFLEILKKYRMGAQIELKEPGYEKLILKKIQDADFDHESLLSPVLCTSFFLNAIFRMEKKVQEYKIQTYRYNERKGLGFGLQGIRLSLFYGNWFLRLCEKRHIWGFTTYYKNLPINKLAYSHEHKVRFCPRLPDNEELINSYIDADVDGFETDNVPFIRNCIEKKGYKLWPIQE